MVSQLQEGWKKRKPWQKGALICTFLSGLFFLFCLPRPLFNTPYSTVVYDRDGILLGARIADDEQWRFPLSDSIPTKFMEAIVLYEDKRFYRHWGVDISSMSRAIWQNLKERKVVSGGSTLTMQLMRLARPKRRNIWAKALETIQALRLEWSYSKQQILQFYAAQAPFGGNVVGLEAAAWRYYGKSSQALSWAEAATLAVLPNAPALVHPGKNRAELLRKRNQLLDKLFAVQKIDATTLSLSKEEPIPLAPQALPQAAPHLTDRLSTAPTAPFYTTLSAHWQGQTNQIAYRYQQQYAQNGINNLAILIARVSDGAILAYTANVEAAGAVHQSSVDCIQAPRSTGSILKPFLYAAALEEGLLSSTMLLRDVPTSLNGFDPENFSRQYDGLVPAHRALERSLNVPFVTLLKEYGVEKWHWWLQRAGMTTLSKPAGHYGLSLVLGGAETTLWDVCGIYASMGRTLIDYQSHDSRYSSQTWHPLHWVPQSKVPVDKKRTASPTLVGAGAIWQTLEAMQALDRPDERGWSTNIDNDRHIAWKTGTSYGLRDAWAVGITSEFVVGVWVGNADGEGRPALTGFSSAAPVLFDVFDVLPRSPMFPFPGDDLERTEVCQTSGYRWQTGCPVDTILTSRNSHLTKACPYHTKMYLDAAQQYQVNSTCYPVQDMQTVYWWQLPALEAWYYAKQHPDYQVAPLFLASCQAGNTTSFRPMELIYPLHETSIMVPTNLDGSRSKVVFQLAHQQPEKKVFWYLDDQYLGTTQVVHELAVDPPMGAHTLVVVDEDGHRLTERVFVKKKLF